MIIPILLGGMAFIFIGGILYFLLFVKKDKHDDKSKPHSDTAPDYFRDIYRNGPHGWRR